MNNSYLRSICNLQTKTELLRKKIIIIEETPKMLKNLNQVSPKLNSNQTPNANLRNLKSESTFTSK
jgi:hypothetical protein